MDALRGTFGGLGTISRARRRQSIISGDGTSSHRHSVATNSPGRGDTIVSVGTRENLAGRGLRRFQLHDPPMSRGAAGSSLPPSPFPADLVSGTKKKRDSHDSAAAVQGSSAGDPPSPRGAANGYVLEPQEKFKPKDLSNLDRKEETVEDGDLSMGVLLAQQQWDDRRSSIVQDDGSENLSVRLVPQAGTKHTTIQFIEPGPGHRQRAGAMGDVPPILHTPPILSPQTSSPSLSTSESTAAHHQSGGSLPKDEVRQHHINVPLSASPAKTRDEEPSLALRAPYSQRRAAASITRQILASTEEVAEPEADTRGVPGSRPISPTDSASRHPRHASLSRSRSRSPTDGERPPSRKSRESTTSSGNKSDGATLLPPASTPTNKEKHGTR